MTKLYTRINSLQHKRHSLH